MDNAHKWTWWMNGAVLVGMMVNSKEKKMGIALITFEYEDGHISEVGKL
jgi:hypothetical protein